MGDEFLVEKEGMSKSLRKYLIIGILVVTILICGFLIYFSFIEFSPEYSCGDGTIYGNCSVNQPYFCEENLLVQNSEVCGCPEGMNLDSEGCSFSYYGEENLSVLDYVYEGEKREFEIKLYPGVYDYVLALPRYLSYEENETPSRADFKFVKIDEEVQREVLIPLVVEIQNMAPWSKDEQAKIAVRLIQNIPYEEPDPVSIFRGIGWSRYSRHPYQVLHENAASCEGKSELLAFLLRELGFEVVLFYYKAENHEAVGIKCPVEYSLNETGYCFVETTLTGPISYSEGRYLGPGGSTKLGAYTEIIHISNGTSLGNNLDEYKDSKILNRLVNKVDEKGYVNYFEKKKLDSLREKYGLIY